VCVYISLSLVCQSLISLYLVLSSLFRPQDSHPQKQAVESLLSLSSAVGTARYGYALSSSLSVSRHLCSYSVRLECMHVVCRGVNVLIAVCACVWLWPTTADLSLSLSHSHSFTSPIVVIPVLILSRTYVSFRLFGTHAHSPTHVLSLTYTHTHTHTHIQRSVPVRRPPGDDCVAAQR
jgi:hypothetical protein